MIHSEKYLLRIADRNSTSNKYVPWQKFYFWIQYVVSLGEVKSASNFEFNYKNRIDFRCFFPFKLMIIANRRYERNSKQYWQLVSRSQCDSLCTLVKYMSATSIPLKHKPETDLKVHKTLNIPGIA